MQYLFSYVCFILKGIERDGRYKENPVTCGIVSSSKELKANFSRHPKQKLFDVSSSKELKDR